MSASELCGYAFRRITLIHLYPGIIGKLIFYTFCTRHTFRLCYLVVAAEEKAV